MKVILACLLSASFAVCTAHAATPVNLQQCAVTPTTGGLLGCPTASVTFGPVSPSTLVRSGVNSAQGWRVFSSLNSADSVYAQDGSWHILSTITPALGSTPPPVTPPATATQSVVITSLDNPQMIVTFTGVPVPGCFTLNTAKVCTP